MIHPFGCPEYINFLKSILFMARDSSSGFQQGHHTFLFGHKKYNRECGRKRTNEQYGLRSAPSARRVVLWHFFVQLFVHFVDTGSVFFAKFLQSYEECQLILTGLPAQISSADRCRLRTANSSWLVPSAVRSRLSLCVSLRQLTLSGFLFQLPSLRSFANSHSGFSQTCLSSPTSSLVEDLESKPFVWFRAKTKGSSALQNTHIVSQRD